MYGVFFRICSLLPSFLCLPKETKQRKCTTNANSRCDLAQGFPARAISAPVYPTLQASCSLKKSARLFLYARSCGRLPRNYVTLILKNSTLF